jgi:isoleucyl-tRNA synthetase
MDVLDVWFDSGSSLKAVYPELDQADLYLEGTDQHRGWFQSSALVHYALYGKLPFKAVTTHGFVTEKYQKLSKSAGNGNFLPDLVSKYGVDSLRYWVASNMSFGDLELTQNNLARSSAAYDKVRNTLRFGMSNLENQVVNELAVLRPFDRYVLSQTEDLYQSFKTRNYNVLMLMNHCTWLSNFYFSTIKDALYCDSKNSANRQAVILTLSKLTKMLLLLIYPAFPFLVAEADQHGFNKEYCLQNLDTSDLGYWEFVEDEREEILKDFEVVRQVNGWHMEEVVVRYNSLLPVDWKMLLGCAKFENWESDGVNIKIASDMKKCLRCRTYHATTNQNELCDRCEHVESEFGVVDDTKLP